MNLFVRLTNKIRRVSDTTSFVEGFFERLWLRCVLYSAEVATALGFSPRVSHHAWHMQERGQRFKLHTRGDFSDMKLFRDIFFKLPYEIHTTVPVKTIVDLGANIGVTTLFFFTRFPEAHIVAVEANPHLIPVLEKNIQNIPHGRVIHAAITSHEGEETLHVDMASVGSSLANRNRSSEVGVVQVPATTLSALTRSSELSVIDILKIDIEGAEWEVFADPALARCVSMIIGEIHVDIARHSIEEFRAVLEKDFVVSITPMEQADRYIVLALRTQDSL